MPKPAPPKVERVVEAPVPTPAPAPVIEVQVPEPEKVVVEEEATVPEIREVSEPQESVVLADPSVEVPQEPQPVVHIPDDVKPILPAHLDADLPPRKTLAEDKKLPTRYASEDDVKEFAHNIWRVKGRQRVVFDTAMEHGIEEAGRILNLRPVSVDGYLGTAARVLGIPKPNRFQPYDRLDAMKRAWAYFKDHPEIDENPLKVVLQRGEIVLIELYRVLRPEDRTQLLEIAKIFASKVKKQ